MKSITMTEFNQRVSSVARNAIERGETVRVTNRGRVVLRLVPEPVSSGDPIDELVAAGLASAPRRGHRPIGHRSPVRLSRDLDELIAEVSDDSAL
ncbi:type II toxin-antitoxin system Phd/YefM family antitoxin [Leucobacter sp. USHLN154]|uniref:type II toxin-antitoxin system Phd/YefM family antitoxin n=1 Tax=Leucobacter sp. USHLN154 TaxID=3081269 RepID=UPI0030189B74